MIAGGFGGIARRTARWMARRGAKNLLLLSRSGPYSDAAQALLDELREQHINVETPKCDVASAEALAAILKNCSDTMPPIKGCIQGAMVLKVRCSFPAVELVLRVSDFSLGRNVRQDDLQRLEQGPLTKG